MRIRSVTFARNLLLVAVMIIVAVDVFLSTYDNTDPKLTETFPFARSKPSCREKINVAFLKVHKAGSSTVLNILQRFGETRNLTFVLPKTGNFLGFPHPIKKNILLDPPPGKPYNMLFSHAIYDRSIFRKLLPEDTVYLSIVREPFELFRSQVRYFGVWPEENISSYLADPQNYDPKNPRRFYTNNLMAYDFGVPKNNLHNSTFVSEYLLSVQDDFDLVLILEYFDESLILLKRLLCWTIKDILYLAKNVSRKKKDVTFSQKDRENHRQWEVADIAVYDFFYHKFWKTLLHVDIDFFEEVKVFKTIRANVNHFCTTVFDKTRLRGGRDFLTVERTDFNEAFVVGFTDCQYLRMEELTFLNVSRARHIRNGAPVY